MKIIYFILSVVFCGISWIQILLNKDHPNRNQIRNWWGLKDPSMNPHWDRIKEPLSPDDNFFHRVKNLITEWVEQPAQRGAKVLSFIILIQFVLLSLAIVI